MAPIDLIGRERRLLIHLKAKRLMDMSFRGDREGHGLGQHIGLPQAEHDAFAGGPRQVGHRVLRKAEVAERSLATTSPKGDRYAVNLARQRPHWFDHQGVLAAQTNSPPASGKKVPKLFDPPREDISKHASTPISGSRTTKVQRP